MKEIYMYVADDGTMFDDEDECRAYELEQALGNFQDGITLYNYKGNKIKINDFNGEAIEFNGLIDEAYFIKVNSADALEAFTDLLYEYGSDTSGLYWDGEPDIFVYGDLCPNGNSGEWNSWNGTVKKLQAFKEEYIDKMRGE